MQEQTGSIPNVREVVRRRYHEFAVCRRLCAFHILPGMSWRANITAVTIVLHLAAGAHALEVDVRPDDKTPYFQFQSARLVGDRGEVSLDVSVPPACGIQWRFHHAELEILHNRFGDAQFVSLPASGCESCDPVIVRWMHEPTGQLAFNVNVYRMRIESPCQEG